MAKEPTKKPAKPAAKKSPAKSAAKAAKGKSMKAEAYRQRLEKARAIEGDDKKSETLRKRTVKVFQDFARKAADLRLTVNESAGKARAFHKEFLDKQKMNKQAKTTLLTIVNMSESKRADFLHDFDAYYRALFQEVWTPELVDMVHMMEADSDPEAATQPDDDKNVVPLKAKTAPKKPAKRTLSPKAQEYADRMAAGEREDEGPEDPETAQFNRDVDGVLGKDGGQTAAE